MEQAAKPNLSLVGDLGTRWIAYIGGVATFAAFAEKIVNGLIGFLGISFQAAYFLFVVFYFMLISFVVLYYMAEKRRVAGFKLSDYELRQGWNNWYSRKKLLLIVSYLVLVFFFWLVVQGMLAFVISIVVLLVVATIGVSLVVMAPGRYNNAIRIEYGVFLLVAVVTFSLFFLKKPPPSRHVTKDVFRMFERREQFKSDLVKLVSALQDTAIVKADRFRARAFPVKEELLLQKDSTVKDTLLIPETIYIPYKRLHAYTRWMYEGVTDSTGNTRARLDTAVALCNQHIDQLIQNTPGILTKLSKIDSVTISSNRKVITEYLRVVQEMAYRVHVTEMKLDGILKKYWVAKLDQLQYKGLLFLFVLLFLLYTRLCLCRMQVEWLNRPAQDDRYEGWSFWRSLAQLYRYPGMTFSVKQQREAGLLHYGNQLKNLIFIVLLLMLPFFRNNTEQNVDLKKPFINFSIEDIVKPFRESGRPGDPNNPFNKIGIYLGGDQSRRKFYDNDTTYNNWSPTIIIVEPAPVGTTDSAAIIRAIRELGKGAILDTVDRRIFLESLK